MMIQAVHKKVYFSPHHKLVKGKRTLFIRERIMKLNTSNVKGCSVVRRLMRKTIILKRQCTMRLVLRETNSA